MTYTPDFFKAISASASESAAVLLPCVFELVGTPTSILDVGCGTGAWLATARELGVAETIGVDGDYLPPEQLVISPNEFVAADLTKPLDLQRRFDVVMTLEVAEHLDEQAASGFVRSLAAHGDVILFSAATPGQGGNHHVNERLPSYWVDLFAAEGYQLFDLVRPRVWADERVMFYYRQNALLFATGEPAERLLRVPRPPIVDIVHPEQLAYWKECGVREGVALTKAAAGRALRRRAERYLGRRRR